MIRNILVVDDSDVDNYVTSQLLSQAKISETVTLKVSGRDAIAYLDNLHQNHLPFPEIILLDINMPDINGFEFLDIFSRYPDEMKSKICIIMLTSSNDMRDKDRALKTGMIMDYFVKPLTKQKVQKMAEHYDTICKPGGK